MHVLVIENNLVQQMSQVHGFQKNKFERYFGSIVKLCLSLFWIKLLVSRSDMSEKYILHWHFGIIMYLNEPGDQCVLDYCRENSMTRFLLLVRNPDPRHS
jgi:hypothetical protein